MDSLLGHLDQKDQDLLNSNIPVVLLCGTPRCGKSSVVDVVLGHQNPSKTLFSEPTLKPLIRRMNIGELFEFAVVEIPTHYITGAPSTDSFDTFLFQRSTTLWLLMDSSQVETIDETSELDPVSQVGSGEELAFCRDLIIRAKSCNPSIYVDVFLHKMDGCQFRTIDSRTAFQSLVCDVLMEGLRPNGNEDHVMMYSTSIYDFSAREATGHMLQRLIPQSNIVTSLLDILVKNCQASQAFILDIRTGLLVGIDSSGFDPICYELCSDMLDIVSTSACLRPKVNDENALLESCSVSMDHGFTIQLKQIDRAISLGLVMKDDAFDVQHLVDVNVGIFADALTRSIKLYDEFTTRKQQPQLTA